MKHLKRLIAPLAITLLMTGCVSTSVKNTLSYFNSGESEIVYGMVSKVWDGKEAFSKPCADGTIHQDFKFVCADIAAYKFVLLNIYKTSGGEPLIRTVVPSAVAIQESSIIEINPKKRGNGFVRVAAETQTDTCHWSGLTSNFNARFAAGYLAGLTLIAAPVVLGSDLMDGGVECNGWSYKELIKQANDRASNTGKADQPAPSMSVR